MSPRELEVLKLLIQGKSNKEIATVLCISERTVEHHIDHIRAKLGARNRLEAAIIALRTGLNNNLR